jgi:hypothetical protein
VMRLGTSVRACGTPMTRPCRVRGWRRGSLSLEALGLDLAVCLFIRLALGRELIDRQIGRPAVLYVEWSEGDEALCQRLRILVAAPLAANWKMSRGNGQACNLRCLRATFAVFVQPSKRLLPYLWTETTCQSSSSPPFGNNWTIGPSASGAAMRRLFRPDAMRNAWP